MRIQDIRYGIITAAIMSLTTLGGQASAEPVLVSESTTGTSGDYTLNFTLTNNIGGDQKIYIFGVALDSGTDFAASPPSFPAHFDAFSVSSFGGSSTVYNNTWLDNVDAGLPSGTTLGGFAVHSTDTTLPTSIPWVVLSFGTTPYTGSGYFNSPTNPGFEGFVGQQSVPEPSSLTLALVGSLGGLGYWLIKSRTPRSKTQRNERSNDGSASVVA
jgi:hypothetical protein